MSRIDALVLRAGMDPDAVKRRVLAGVVIGLVVVLIDRTLGLGS